ncbi:hypothetical protein OSB04_015823 [Centaurea solstitialis]|uniref:F-box domain-containing protein n=1 Tax=Centaurea solstitialis TaxID=347529 RepID=A0AA38T7J3_9ASTR|nr:hypothetical protein OSB04_015823 [Centaurea solstitialis]
MPPLPPYATIDLGSYKAILNGHMWQSVPHRYHPHTGGNTVVDEGTLIHPSMEDLPVELTIDIHSRLPVKAIIHYKLVCKKWRNLVSNASFVNLLLSRSPTGLIVHHHPRINRTND